MLRERAMTGMRQRLRATGAAVVFIAGLITVSTVGLAGPATSPAIHIVAGAAGAAAAAAGAAEAAAGAAEAAAGTAGEATDLRLLDPSFRAPAGPVDEQTARGVRDLLQRQEEALKALDLRAFLATFIPRPAAGPRPAEFAALSLPPVYGSPADRAETDLSGALAVAAQAVHVDLTPRFVVPGADGTAEALVHLTLAYRDSRGQFGLLELTVLERLGPDSLGRWWVVDWFQTPEREARLTWPVWLEGKVFLDPFEGLLRGEMVCSFYDGFLASGQGLSLILGESFSVTSVETPSGPVKWERSGSNLRVAADRSSDSGSSPGSGGEPLVVTILYEGYVSPDGDRRGNLERLGDEGIHLRPATGWYPRLPGAGAVRGAITAIVPSWWSAVAPGRLTGRLETAEWASFTWSLDSPVEVYLAAGPYSVQTRATAGGVVLRTFFYPLKNTYAAGYLAEAESILAFFSATFGEFPFPNLSLVEVPDFYYGGLSARSFVILDKDAIYDPRVHTQARNLLAHEISHQWWGEVVPVIGDIDWFLWEGLATYSEALYAEARDGPEALARTMRANAVVLAEGVRDGESLSIAEANVRRERWHDRLLYEKGAWVFHTLRFLLGDEAFFGLVREYANRFAGRSPKTADLEELILTASAGDPYLETYVERWVRGTSEVDLALSSVSARPTSAGGMDLTFTLGDQASGAFPRAEVSFVLRNGDRRTLDLNRGTHTLIFDHPVSSVVIDPGHWVLDANLANNSYQIVGGTAVASAAIAAAMKSVPAVLLIVALILAGRKVLRRGAAPVAPVDAEDPEC